jgi:2-polyprenyl-3-methyl-5-hydroxy-6-metoxy-1,4-benzoquinol methylase
MNDSAEKNNERDFYNAVAEMRSVEDFIPVEADYRTSSFYIPENLEGIVIDSKMMNILSNGVIDEILENMKEKKLRVLDVCCGMGWLSLELARHGHCVEAYDLSNKSIDYAKEIRDLNSGADGFGVINYHNADVTKRNFEKDEFDVVIGWSAFHHKPNVEGFLDACKNSLKKGGIIITYDDFARGRKEIFFELLADFIFLLKYKRFYYYNFLA